MQAPPEFSWIIEVATGATIGGVISTCIIGFELFGAAHLFERGGHRLPLLAALLLRTIVYGVVIMAALLVVPWVYSGEKPSPLPVACDDDDADACPAWDAPAAE